MMRMLQNIFNSIYLYGKMYVLQIF